MGALNLLHPFISLYVIRWSGSGEQEHAIDKKSGKTVVRVDSKYFRPAEVEYVHTKYP